MGYEIRERCIGLLADRTLHPAEIGKALGTSMGEVQAALHEGWNDFRQVAGPTGFRWARADSAIARAAQRAVVACYTPNTYALRTSKPTQHGDLATVDPTPPVPDVLSGANALGRALYAKGEGTVEELAAIAGCRVSTIRQQASRFARHLTTTRELMTSPDGNRYWRTVRVALKARA